VTRYKQQPMDFAALKTIPIQERGGKVRAEDFATPYRKGSGVSGFVDSLPHILAGDSFRQLVDAVANARSASKPVLWGLGGHVVKCGLAPILIDLIGRGYATAFALNGAAAIHDFEIAIAGQTSEDVEAVLPDGRFGTAEETGREMNRAIAQGVEQPLAGRLGASGAEALLHPERQHGQSGVTEESAGFGELLGCRLDAIADPRYASHSLLLAAWRNSAPVTVHVAVGTDTPHAHPAADGAAIGAASHRDFRLFCSLVAEMNQGGVYINVGSAVILPEVFLKAVSVVRNLGRPLADFTTANLDFLQHYRPRVNVVERPHARAGGRGISITGHHELTLPLLVAALIERAP